MITSVLSTFTSLSTFSVTELLLASAVFGLAFWIIESYSQKIPKGLKSPPGPWAWPLIGNILTLGKNPHLALAQLREKYGDVMQIQIGSTPVLVLSGLETIRQALIRQGDDFKGRPDLYSFSLIEDGQSMSFGPDTGEAWAARRKMAQNALKTFSVSSSPSSSSCYLEEHVRKEAECLIQKFQEKKGPFDPFRYVMVSVANVICAICFGKRYNHEDQELLSIITLSTKFGEVTASGNPADFIPLLQYLPSSKMTDFRDLNEKITNFVQKLVNEHYKKYEKALTPSPRAFPGVSCILWQSLRSRRRSTRSWVGGRNGKTLPDSFWDTVIGRARWPKLSDKPQLPYLEAFILETFRHSSFLPFTIPHSTTRATTLNNFYIPKGRCVFVNQWQINHDPKIWGDPSEFRPERFLSADGTINKSLSEKVIMFGLGKRKCIGETIARWEVFLFLAILLHQMEFSVPSGVKVDLTPIYGLTMKHASCEHFQVKLRS
ncbi:cytochrome P450 1A1 isoform X2 [Sarcophilus harrisii]|uniref:cytochrome P450 1A1 isoform X2 n=1 Tax=Sarcophilus harrisii TaxID=9305 RepID=UPI0013020013|nr:cytochrome P450 1A1 isoform X2 [Sarcophilus harrisii]